MKRALEVWLYVWEPEMSKIRLEANNFLVDFFGSMRLISKISLATNTSHMAFTCRIDSWKFQGGRKNFLQEWNF